LTLVVWSAVHHFHWCLATCWKAVLRWNAVYHEHSAVSHPPLTPVPKPELSSQQLNKQANAVPTFVTRWNLYPRVHKIGLWKWLTSFVSVHRYRQNFGCTREWKHASIIIIMPGTGGRLVVSITPLPLYTRGNSSETYCIGLDAMEKRKISCPSRESNTNALLVHIVARRYTDWAISAPLSMHCTLN
jgi:hypothetical protein